MGVCMSKNNCAGMSLYVIGIKICDIKYYHSHCCDLIPEKRIICNNPIYWWQRRCNNSRCNSNRHLEIYNLIR